MTADVKGLSEIVFESPTQSYLTERKDNININKQDLNQAELCQLQQEEAV